MTSYFDSRLSSTHEYEGTPSSVSYVDGEFVGGCDIVTEAFQSGELDETFAKAGVKE